MTSYSRWLFAAGGALAESRRDVISEARSRPRAARRGIGRAQGSPRKSRPPRRNFEGRRVGCAIRRVGRSKGMRHWSQGARLPSQDSMGSRGNLGGISDHLVGEIPKFMKNHRPAPVSPPPGGHLTRMMMSRHSRGNLAQSRGVPRNLGPAPRIRAFRSRAISGDPQGSKSCLHRPPSRWGRGSKGELCLERSSSGRARLSGSSRLTLG